ncbi:hypothetical protein [Pandoraea anhela]|uniref:hypothetical protein n=1 Tax=Pandoraea anhela TaxID=2508295 RepID=UPI0015832E93|nr:hypothetical protein [Pandoraea anhela]
MSPFRNMAMLGALVGVLGLTACTTRPFQPAPPLYTLWAKPGVDEQGVRRAMLTCGFPDSAYVSTKAMSTNDWAKGELCMIERGFQYQDRRILCTDLRDLPACANVPRGKTFGTDPDFDPTSVPPRDPAAACRGTPADATQGCAPSTSSGRK